MLVAINHETIEYTLNSFIITTTVNKHTFTIITTAESFHTLHICHKLIQNHVTSNNTKYI